MNQAHYTPRLDAEGYWFFTTPYGRSQRVPLRAQCHHLAELTSERDEHCPHFAAKVRHHRILTAQKHATASQP